MKNQAKLVCAYVYLYVSVCVTKKKLFVSPHLKEIIEAKEGGQGLSLGWSWGEAYGSRSLYKVNLE